MPTTPPTFVAGDPIAAAELNQLGDGITELQAVTEGIAFSGVRLYKTSQSIGNAAYTNIAWASEVYDYGGWWSSGVNAVVPAGAIPSGYTQIAVDFNLIVRWAASGTGSRRVNVRVNGTEFTGTSASGISGDTLEQVLPVTLIVAAGDTINAQAYQSSGGSLTLDYAYLTIRRVAPVA